MLTKDIADRDFDFAGATAKIADVIHEEQAVYTRSNTKKQPAPKPAAAPKATPTVQETSHLPALVPDMSLWGSPAPAPSEQHLPYEPMHHNRQFQSGVSAPPATKRFMSLEEVEAQILSMNQKPVPSPQPQVHYQPQAPIGQQMGHQFQHQIPQHTPSPGSHISQFAPPPVDLRAFSSQQLPPHLQQLLQQNQVPQLQQNAQQLQQQFQQERMLAQQQQQQQQLQQQQLQQQQLQQQQQQPTQQRAPLREPEPIASRTQYGMPPHVPAQQLQSMTEADRLRFLEEESKRLKRNHKIAQLVRSTSK